MMGFLTLFTAPTPTPIQSKSLDVREMLYHFERLKNLITPNYKGARSK